MDALRRQARRPVGAVGLAELFDRPDPQDAWDAAAERASTEWALALIATLPRDQAEAVLLRAVVGASYDGGWWSARDIPGVCASNCFVWLADIQAANPDALTLGANGSATVYDFEHVTTLTGKDQCKHGGWLTSTNPSFDNQGACVSHFASNGKAHPNR